MRRQAEYMEILGLLQQSLHEKYETESAPSSNEFERATVEVLKDTIDNWNQAQDEDHRLDLEVVYLGGNRFPDIVCRNNTDGEKFGIEVKFHKSSRQWETLGNSAFASTQETNLEAIYILFGHFAFTPSQFRIKLMDDCVSDIEATHNPRYSIDMDAEEDFFRAQLGIPYDELRALSESQRKIIVNSYMASKKYIDLSEREDKDLIRAQCFILFPEIFSLDKRKKYKRMGVWLFANNIFCRNVRDFISGSGQRKIDIVGDEPLPKVFFRLYQSREIIKREIGEIHSSLLLRSWYPDEAGTVTIPDTAEDRLAIWESLITAEFGGATQKIDQTEYEFVETIEALLR